MRWFPNSLTKVSYIRDTAKARIEADLYLVVTKTTLSIVDMNSSHQNWRSVMSPKLMVGILKDTRGQWSHTGALVLARAPHLTSFTTAVGQMMMNQANQCSLRMKLIS